jgi:hypothetical protein
VRPHLSIVSGYGNDRVTPRGQRTRWLAGALEEEWDVDLIAMPGKTSSAAPGGTTSRRAAARRLAARLLYKVLLDRWEPWSVRRLASWRPDRGTAGALLIASPWSPAIYASRRLVRAGVPYVVDAGDPWVLTATYRDAVSPLWRASSAEHFLWRHASGAVLTTRAQYEKLHNLFPKLPILVRPNGYQPVELQGEPAALSSHRTLRIAHFGILSASRIDPVPLLTELSASGHWDSIVFSQFGDDFGVGLDRLPKAVAVERHLPLDWQQVMSRAHEFDAALVVAYPLPDLLPSKVIEYSTLPLPRIALTNSDPGDSLREFTRSRPGWLALSSGEPDLAERTARHLSHEWTAAELAPLEEDSWPVVAAAVKDFVCACVRGVEAMPTTS